MVIEQGALFFLTNPAHVPCWWMNNPTLGLCCEAMIGRADIEESKSTINCPASLLYSVGQTRSTPQLSNTDENAEVCIGAATHAMLCFTLVDTVVSPPHLLSAHHTHGVFSYGLVLCRHFRVITVPCAR